MNHILDAKQYLAWDVGMKDETVNCTAKNLLYKIGELEMTNIATEALEVANAIAPNAPVVATGAAIAATVGDPSPSNIIADIELALSLIKQLTALMRKHSSIVAIVKAML